MRTFEEELERTGHLVYTNKGVSMMPLLRQGRDVLVIRAQKSGFQKNDAVLFKRENGQYVLHRITKCNPDGTYYIVGDNCISGERIREDQLLGVLTQVRRNNRTVASDDLDYRLYVKLLPIRRLFLRVKFGAYRAARKVIQKPVRTALKKVYFSVKKSR